MGKGKNKTKTGLPASLNIGGHRVTVQAGKKQEFFEGANKLGEFETEKWTIHLKAGMNATFTKQILAHEILHAFFTVAELPGVDYDLEEKLCKGLENHLFRFLADNDLTFFSENS